MYCYNILKNPVECKSCNTNFCEEHINDFEKCPSCNAPFSSFVNEGIKKLLTKYEHKIINDRIKTDEDIIKCNLCSFEDKPGYFCFHLAEEHKKDLIEIFGKKIYQIKKEDHQFVHNKKKYEKYNTTDNIIYNNPFEISQIDNNNNNTNNDNISNNYNNDSNNTINIIRLNSEKKLNSYMDEFTEIKDENPLFRSQITNLYYCKKNNKDINCKCCPDHICREGNCLCVKCMFYNVKKFGLKYGELYNKSGRVAKPNEYYLYHCGIKLEKSITNSIGQVFQSHTLCSFNYFCKECKELNIYKKIYLDYISQKTFCNSFFFNKKFK